MLPKNLKERNTLLEIRTPEELIIKLKSKSEDYLVQKVEEVIEGIGLSTEDKWKKLKEWLDTSESQKIVEIFEKEDPKIKEKLIIDDRLAELQKRTSESSAAESLRSSQQSIHNPDTSPKSNNGHTSPSITENPIEWAKENKLAASWIALWTAVIWYYAISKLFWDSPSKSDDKKSDDKKEGFIDWALEKAWIKWDYLKWAKWFWILWVLTAVGIWLFMWKDKITEYWWNISDFFGWESSENREARIKTQEVLKNWWFEVSDDLLKKARKSDISARTFTSSYYWTVKGVLTAIWDMTWDKIPGYIKEKLWMDYTKEELEELLKIQEYLKKETIKPWENATLEDVFLAIAAGWTYINEKDPTRNVFIGTEAVEEAAKDPQLTEPEVKEQSAWYLPPILGARAYQFYHWTYKPYNNLNLNEKNIFKGALANFFSRKDQDFKAAKKNLPNLENELEALKTQNIQEKTNIIRQEFDSWKWVHAKYWRIDNVLLDPHNEYKKILWYEGKVFQPLTPESHDFAMKYYQYLAEQEHSIISTAIENEIKAIKGWPELYKKFSALRLTPEKFIERLSDIEFRRVNNFRSMTWANSLDAAEWKNFIAMWQELNWTINEKNLVIGKIASEIWELSKEFNNPSTSPARKAELELATKNKLWEIKSIEDEARKLVNRFVTENEKQMVNILDTTNKKTLKHSFLGFFERLKWNTKAKDLFDLELVSPEKKFLRFSLSWTWNKIMLIWIWAWVLLSAWDWDKKEIDSENLKHTAKRVWAWFIPVYGTYLDAKDMAHSFAKWEMLGWFANMWAMVASWAWDLLLAMSFIPWFAPFGIWWKMWLSALRWTLKSWVAVKAISEAPEVLATWKVAMTLENWLWKVSWQLVLDCEAWAQKILEWTGNVSRIVRERTVKVLKYWMVWGAVMALWLWAWVPLTSWGLSKIWLLEEQKTEQE